MGIGVSVFLIAVGLILALATHIVVSGLDLHTVGWILVAVGVLGLVMTTLIWGPRRRAVGTGAVVEERRVYDDRGTL